MKFSLLSVVTSENTDINKKTRLKTETREGHGFEMHGVEMNTVNLSCFINI